MFRFLMGIAFIKCQRRGFFVFFFFFFLGIRRIFEVNKTVIACKISTIVCLWRGMFCVLLQGSPCQDKALIYTSVNLIVLFSVINYWLHIENFFLCHCVN